MELVGGILTNSLALLSDAGHVFMDVLALILSFTALKIAQRPPTITSTYGYHRFEIFAAFINGITLLAIIAVIFYKGYHRILEPIEVHVEGMMGVALVGLVINLIVAFKLRGHHDLNIRGAYLHVLGDTFSSVAVIAGGGLMLIGAPFIIDPILSLFIACIILVGSIRLLKESISVMMERIPSNIDIDEIRNTLKGPEEIIDIHDLHFWSICSNINALTAHFLVDPQLTVENTEGLTQKFRQILRERFNIHHVTLQFETEECGDEEELNIIIH